MLIYAIKVAPLKSQPTLRRLERDRALIRANEAWRADRIHRPRPKTTHARNGAEVPDLLLHLLHLLIGGTKTGGTGNWAGCAGWNVPPTRGSS